MPNVSPPTRRACCVWIFFLFFFFLTFLTTAMFHRNLFFSLFQWRICTRTTVDNNLGETRPGRGRVSPPRLSVSFWSHLSFLSFPDMSHTVCFSWIGHSSVCVHTNLFTLSCMAPLQEEPQSVMELWGMKNINGLKVFWRCVCVCARAHMRACVCLCVCSWGPEYFFICKILIFSAKDLQIYYSVTEPKPNNRSANIFSDPSICQF